MGVICWGKIAGVVCSATIFFQRPQWPEMRLGGIANLVVKTLIAALPRAQSY